MGTIPSVLILLVLLIEHMSPRRHLFRNMGDSSYTSLQLLDIIIQVTHSSPVGGNITTNMMITARETAVVAM